MVVLNRVKGTISEWLASINNPKLYYVYESHEYLSNPFLVRLRKEFPDMLVHIDKAIKQIKTVSKKASVDIPKELPKKEDKNVVDIVIEKDV